ncbi:hypothetical protein C2S52_011271 [Perilla frutescens var. hirtella]|nr:hypothetical protein C2S52_011271 [Perilla frutescens var. hirtella]KAH6786047.1 hypothetical protein C2S51_038502 [Perilla frutescens var. frutescens]
MKTTGEFSACTMFLLLLLLVGSVGDARKDHPGEYYWKNMMKDEAMPKAITDLMDQNPASDSTNRDDHFVTNFETKPNVIIYHTHSKQSELQPLED